jgi:hypothetical protein
VQCVAVVRRKCLALQNVTRRLIAATNATILLPVANLTRSGHTGQLEKIPDTATNSSATVFGSTASEIADVRTHLGRVKISGITALGIWFIKKEDGDSFVTGIYTSALSEEVQEWHRLYFSLTSKRKTSRTVCYSCT